MAPADHKLQKRLRRLQRELEDEDIKLVAPLWAGLFDAEEDAVNEHLKQWESMVLSELLYDLHPPVHEGRRQSYGAIVASSLPFSALSIYGASVLEVGADATIEDLRPLANGVTSFVHMNVTQTPALIAFSAIGRSDTCRAVLPEQCRNCTTASFRDSASVRPSVAIRT